jgi:N-acetylglucosaminyldiphosphoundecaprenol N-acetyl-beta-D-mannosaminyltransferase
MSSSQEEPLGVLADGVLADGPRSLTVERSSRLESRYIAGMRVDRTDYEDAARRIVDWGKKHESRYVCIASVNNVMEARASEAFRQIMNTADLVTSDGMPLVWSLRLLGLTQATRVYGPDLTPILCEQAAEAGVPIGFYGGTPEVLELFISNLKHRFPKLQVVYRFAPPFRSLTPEEDKMIDADLIASGAGIVFVGLGTPKQERWMAARRGSIPATMVGVGAAFDFLAGKKRQAPHFMQRVGLEWFFRLCSEPRRLWKRYLYRNPRFVFLLGRQLLAGRLRTTADSSLPE